MRIYRSHQPVIFNYIIYNVTLETVKYFNDLGIIFDKELNFIKNLF